MHEVVCGAVLFTGLVVVGAALYSRTEHRNALDGRRLNWSLTAGFVVENIGRYRGSKGAYHDYFIRVYVDPNSRFYRRLGPDLRIMVYFAPMRRPDGKRDIALLRRIEGDILNEMSWFQWEFLICHAIHMHQRTRFTLLTGQRRIQKRIDRVVSKVSKYGPKPWPEADVERWVREAADLHGPGIHEFQENFPMREGPY